MAEKTIMLACSAGMSTSLLVSKMQAAAKADGVDYHIFATAASDIDHQLNSENHPDVLLLGPQIGYMAADIKKKTDAAGIPMAPINMQDYGMMNGENVLTTAEKLMGDK
ncbi:PTS sugar transporter subunit IIB [Lactiplantibacillus fabifermentans]|uniref:Cellobiose PTS, EIIB n=2 Tax=Lactiplantibacillus fabifermentans TaxID=483011 RepID=A0A0R2NWE5_9LACO|nr:PTS sugar transporter subunit IIB [Lactiplantibacillus fabifermentans]ETY75703.1 PTS sugar transporter [Lactiplantibacillus fabifermentans T30PCM01]KRO28779.1 cellobiose PTS, EIIB [Lactiplantibacillus fabifermentans DSM 21115]